MLRIWLYKCLEKLVWTFEISPCNFGPNCWEYDSRNALKKGFGLSKSSAEQMTSPWFWQVDLLRHYIWLIMQAQLNNPRFNGRMIIFDKQEMVVVWKKCLENISWAQNILTTSKVPHFRFITSKGPLKCVQENMSSDWQIDFQWTFFSKKFLHQKDR